MIPTIDARALLAGDGGEIARVAEAAAEIGFMTVTNTPLSRARVLDVLDGYRAFFALPDAEKAEVDMSRTGASRGWGASRSEQVDPGSNPDFKEVFDCGHEWPESGLRVYAPNLWPQRPSGFRALLEGYYADACAFSRELLGAIAEAVGEDRAYFAEAFDRPMALLRGNFYPKRPDWAGDRDFGIGSHTDYGCLTLLATDGVAGLEVRGRAGRWVNVETEPGDFVINFGEMLEMWTAGRIRATEHRVIGTAQERLSIPLFFNPRFDVNVAPSGSGKVIRAADHLQKRYDETYLHLKAARA
ncbi:isopenicillin N synthase family dioxygenase [Pelagovum pacificum]|uniref:2-oxoglutarate-dependent ethylene/succinate-forming enzyme n=1 Tax=Pelagovum pacificum TaxID=2588711 RepID=A0A5C5GDE2_9RHOB|nr:2-oxoglutarate and iron-dependent oxygenase domain-containing protein [Pelagovum pacificum]QQA41191.1 isopenicillin N synthase family oxygenase [Pelagovum pacificum]TNY32001.1 isopenicillin N synthase family oxygenase [Pelagovum pacificum]